MFRHMFPSVAIQHIRSLRVFKNFQFLCLSLRVSNFLALNSTVFTSTQLFKFILKRFNKGKLRYVFVNNLNLKIKILKNIRLLPNERRYRNGRKRNWSHQYSYFQIIIVFFIVFLLVLMSMLKSISILSGLISKCFGNSKNSSFVVWNDQRDYVGRSFLK